MPFPRPPRGVRWILAQTVTYDFLIALFASAIGISSALTYLSQGKGAQGFLVLFATVGVVIATGLKHGIALAAARKKESTHELEGCLYTLHAVLAPEACRLRLAIHVPVEEMFEQVTEYIGDTPRPGRIGRQFPANAGIIGKAYRERDVFIGRRANDDYDAYVTELVRDWNYTEGRARRLNPATMEWMAVPFYDPHLDVVEAVLYLDANQRGFFTQERQELVLLAVTGIAVFVGKRYS